MKLNKKQTIALDYLEDDKTTEIYYGGAAGGGKSFLGDYWIAQQAAKYPGTRWMIGRAKLKTLKQTTLVTFWKICKLQGLREGIHYKYNQQMNEFKFRNGSDILLKDLFFYPSDPEFDELGSLEITGAFIDEINQVVEKAKNVTKTRIRHALDENNLIPKLLGTCNPAKNWVKKEAYHKWKTGKLEPFKQFIPAYVTDNPDISKHYVANLISTGDKATIERLLNGNWDYDDDPYLLMDYDSIIDLWSNYADYGKRYITADIARFGSDWFFGFVWDGWCIIDYFKMEKSDTQEVVDMIEHHRQKHSVQRSHVICDQDGVGGGVVDIGKYKGFQNNASPLAEPKAKKPNYASLADQCAFNMAGRVSRGEIKIECQLSKEVESRLIDEFQVIKEDAKRLETDRKRKIISKDDQKALLGGKSPDIWDAFKMRDYFELNSRKMRIA